jgi:GNAT superfamily N-acetyltransferase
MSPVKTVAEALAAVQQAKAGAPAFCTNFFPVQPKMQAWIDHDELYSEHREGAAFFLKKDRDFWHFYFCAPSVLALERQLATAPAMNRERLVVDLVGNEPALAELLGIFDSNGFRRYSRLLRLARVGQTTIPAAIDQEHVVFADKADAPAIQDLLEDSFDRYADQLPMSYELEAALAARQVLAIKREQAIGAALFFETQGLTSTVRYWVVAQPFRSQSFGSRLIRHYFAAQNGVRRFILWVTANNDNAVQKYQHYGYSPDGLVDHVLVNEMIRP